MKHIKMKIAVLACCIACAGAMIQCLLFAGANDPFHRLLDDKGRVLQITGSAGDIYRVIDYAEGNIPEGSICLVFNVNAGDFGFYSGHRMFVDMAPEMLPFFQAESPSDARKILEQLNIEYIVAPSVPIPAWSRSFAKVLCSDDAETELVYQSGNSKLYRLRKPVDDA